MKHNSLVVLLGWILATAALAAEVRFQPFESPKVTLDQWTAYHDEVKAAFGATAQERPAEHALMYFDDSTRTQYIFTTPSNPAHPGWISRRIVTRSGMSSIEQVGYFGGSLEAFTAWFSSYQRQNQQSRQPQ
jgi:hypothetical protein